MKTLTTCRTLTEGLPGTCRKPCLAHLPHTESAQPRDGGVFIQDTEPRGGGEGGADHPPSHPGSSGNVKVGGTTENFAGVSDLLFGTRGINLSVNKLETLICLFVLF